MLPRAVGSRLLCMRWSFAPALLSMGALSGVFFASAQNTFAQTSGSGETAQTGALITKLSPPVYPPLARQARIMGDVKVYVHVRKDGGVESTELFDGHPMLIQAALESAKKSQFECQGCSADITSYLLTYTFKIGGECPRYGPNCEGAEEEIPPKVEQSLGHVVVTTSPLCTCDPVTTITCHRRRSAKCLYLWRCGSRVTDVQ